MNNPQHQFFPHSVTVSHVQVLTSAPAPPPVNTTCLAYIRIELVKWLVGGEEHCTQKHENNIGSEGNCDQLLLCMLAGTLKLLN